jgi:hypothetical protein
MKLIDIIALRRELVKIEGVNAVVPLVADEHTRYPFVAYERVGTEPSAYKRGEQVAAMTVELSVWSENYDESLALADECIARAGANGWRLQNATEECVIGAYCQRLTLRIDG